MHLKPEFSPTESVKPTTNNNNNDPSPSSPKQNNITFHPIPSTLIKPSPKTRNQKEKQKKINMVQNKGPLNKTKLLKDIKLTINDEEKGLKLITFTDPTS